MSTRKVVSIKSILDMDTFSPHYQGDHPIEFGARVNWYMERYWNPNQPETYMDKAKFAVEYANKSIMLEKLGIDPEDDLEAADPDTFKSVFTDLAKSNDGLVVDGECVSVAPSLAKSMNGLASANQLYESLWKQTFDTLKTKRRI